ncbi:16S rRNA (cytidine(1402)-2'-O)-methyltransferase [Tessaracoccus sp. OH4464_COT-324]|uniref:16S rRNA (cytidine(1402)-2'-O)-methyltransferase n=1 Tax=Tessaracoccus sp. OH4464_COT-324 TaxID=2491059 RepID=UPI000F6440F7|nr:16S rRNA (cytidine(1402)-2'-O)-methyltransferase [Tessaracoccus sp. OH4464_COT-324]RRD45266.1 16S rRNA (cytidine(1402)-2'-O)-methyltransferase [Tessaracoccus sp. OH4464_COT-324]
MSSGHLILAATPIGSSRDASASLRDLLTTADIVAAEDTRRAVTLLRRLDITAGGRLVSYFEGNELERTPELVAAARAGHTVALITDAGMPCVSDPGYRLVTAFLAAGLRVTALPGPSAVLTALAVSGLPVDRFCFEGFLPRKSGERGRRLAALAGEERTMVFFEAPHRTHEFLLDAARALGAGRRVAVCRELTKPHEEVLRATLSEAVQWAADGVRGEVTIVVEGAPPKETSIDDALGLVKARIADGAKLSEAVAEVAALTGARKKELYAAAVSFKEGRP